MAAAKKRPSRAWRVARAVGLTLFLLVVLAVAGLLVLYKTIDLPSANTAFTAQTTRVYYANGKGLLGTFAEQNRQSVPLSAVPEHVQDAVIAAEDRTFYDNQGIDLGGIVRAALNNAQGGSTQGASTITQQYVKVLYLTQEQSYSRKVREAILALKVQRQQTKAEVLEGYLNTIYFGRGAYGIQAAAQAYFEKDAKDLTVREGAALASIINSPETLDPDNGRAARTALRERYAYVLDGMAEAGAIDSAQLDKALRRLPAFPEIEEEQRFGGTKGYLLKLVQDQLLAAGFEEAEIRGGGLSVVTTFKRGDQRAAVQAVKQEQPTVNAAGVHIGLAAVEPGTGALRAMYGGPNYITKAFNYALAGQPPGSSFKPFALAAALQSGFSLQDTVTGNTYTYPDGSTIDNEFGLSYGPAISILEATRVSSNTGYADLVGQMRNGPKKVIKAAAAAGIPRKAPGLEPVAGVALGTADIAPIEMATAYATFAAEGTQADWYVLEKVENDDGQKVYQHRATTGRAFSPAVAADVTYALRNVVLSGTGTAAQTLGCPVAGKTGTAALRPKTVTSAWFVGYTPRLAAAVMYIRGDGRVDLDGVGGLPTFFGGVYPAQTFTAFMTKAGQGSDCADFPPPANLDGDAGTPSTTPPPVTSVVPPPTSSSPVATTTSPAPSPTTPTPTPSKTTATPTKSPTPSRTPSPSKSPSETPSPSKSPSETPSPSKTPQPSRTPSPSQTPSPSPPPSRTPSPNPTPTSESNPTPTSEPNPTPTSEPTRTQGPSDGAAAGFPPGGGGTTPRPNGRAGGGG